MRINISHYFEMLRFCVDDFKTVDDVKDHLGFLKPVTAKHLAKLTQAGLMDTYLLKDGYRGHGLRMYCAKDGWTEEQVKTAFTNVFKHYECSKKQMDQSENYCIKKTVNGVTKVSFTNKAPKIIKEPKKVKYGVGMGKMAYC